VSIFFTKLKVAYIFYFPSIPNEPKNKNIIFFFSYLLALSLQQNEDDLEAASSNPNQINKDNKSQPSQPSSSSSNKAITSRSSNGTGSSSSEKKNNSSSKKEGKNVSQMLLFILQSNITL
jgi:hypothetical protein